MSFEKGFITVLTKAVLLIVLIPTISFAQDNAAKKTDPVISAIRSCRFENPDPHLKATANSAQTLYGKMTVNGKAAPGTAAAFLELLKLDPNGPCGTWARDILTDPGATWPDWDGVIPTVNSSTTQTIHTPAMPILGQNVTPAVIDTSAVAQTPEPAALKGNEKDEASIPTEISMADTLDFIKRKLSDPQEVRQQTSCPGNDPVAWIVHQTWRSSGLTAAENLINIMGEETRQSGTGPEVAYKTWTRFRLDQLDSGSVKVENGKRLPECRQVVVEEATWYVIASRMGRSVPIETVYRQSGPFSAAECTFYEQRTQEFKCIDSGNAVLEKTSMLRLRFIDKQTATRVAKALVHAIVLATPNAKPDVF